MTATTFEFKQPLMGFADWWQREGSWVEEPNQRRGGSSGVQILQSIDGPLYVKRQVNHIYRSLRHPLGRPTVLREREALFALQSLGIRVPQLVYCGVERQAGKWHALLATLGLKDYVDLQTWYNAGQVEQLGPEVHQELLRQLAATLVRMHRAGWEHGCLYAKHIFVRWIEQQGNQAVQVALLDLEKCRRPLIRKRAGGRDIAQLRRHSPFDDKDWNSLLRYYRDYLQA